MRIEVYVFCVDPKTLCQIMYVVLQHAILSPQSSRRILVLSQIVVVGHAKTRNTNKINIVCWLLWHIRIERIQVEHTVLLLTTALLYYSILQFEYLKCLRVIYVATVF